jgi:Flp pilus assembly protein TadD
MRPQYIAGPPGAPLCRQFSPSVNPLIIALALAALVLAGPATAEDPPPRSTAATEVGALMKAGRNDEALRRADARLKENPRDAQVRFMRGVILADQGRTVEATLAFETLIQEFPELPEPYNNLAALHAAQGRYDSAYRLLQQALAAQPNYLTAYENLGDLYLSMAEQAYGKSLAPGADNGTAKAKLDAARELNQRIREMR